MILICRKCGHEWETRIDRRPKCCPGCKSYTYDRDPQKAERDRRMRDAMADDLRQIEKEFNFGA